MYSGGRGPPRGRGGGRGRGRGGGRGGGRGRGRGGASGPATSAGDESGAREKRPPFMGYRRLTDLSGKEPHELATSLLSTRSGFRELLEANYVQPDWTSLLLGILQKACSSRAYPKLVSQVLTLLRNSTFFKVIIPQYLSHVSIESSFDSQKSYQTPLIDLLKLIRELMTRMPNSFLDINHVTVQLESTIQSMRQNSTIVDEEMETELAFVVTMRDDLAQRMRERGNRRVEDRGGFEFAPPPDDFREKSIFPQLADIDDFDPFLRASRVKGEYPDVETYLDIQFRLLREDFVRPLREGIQEYLDVTANRGNVKRIQNVRVYQGVHILCPVCTYSGISYRIRFDTSRLRRLNWERSRRLIFGSLLCLSKDQFRTLLFATVADRKPKDLEKGELEVRFENLDIDDIDMTDNFTMVETSAYFEAYRHVLKALQDTNEHNFPFQKYIINCSLKDGDMKPPAYLLRRGVLPRYDLTPFLKKDVPASVAKTVAPLTTSRWPPKEYMQFDDSQLAAVQAALTKEFVIIQGPPGTGKTYIGLKIVEVLLRNKEYWHSDGREKSPIFIVCYTNHALDQFLEGIHEFNPEGIVRVGGRSTSTVLEKCKLAHLRAKVKSNRETPRDIFQGLRDTRDEMTAVRSRIDTITANIQATSKGIIKESVVGNVVDDPLFEQLDIVPFGERTTSASVFVDWLGLGNIVYSSGGQAMAEERENEDEEDEDEEEEEELAIDDEGAMRERNLIDDIDEEDMTPVQREEQRRRILQERATEDLAINLDTIGKSQFDEGGWEIQNPKERKKRMRKGLSSTDSMTEQEVQRIRDVWALSLDQRWRLYRYWINRYIANLRNSIKDLERRYDDAAGRTQEIKMQEDMHIMRNATILGMTTTGAAKYRAALQQVKPAIVIVEEAAEVLEAHIVTTLSEGCQHLILIGDHKQLRPSANVYELATMFNLEISLFERMVNNEVSYRCLQLQHRMRPTIAQLMEPIYPELKNHPSVAEFEDVKGVSTNLFFINHVQPESHSEELKSKSNLHEATYVVALCRYLVLQGYSPEQITILTLYSGQLFLIREHMKPKDFFKGVHLTVVDNFQGEENDIILLSLVRSNPDGSIGFLKIDNRVCVALSRARKGMYVIGNFDLLQSSPKAKLWNKLVCIVNKEALIGKELPLYCQNHKSKQILAKSAMDFMKAPEGGCTEPCDARLDCGHSCPRVCHHDDTDHSKFKCMKPCGKVVCENEHRCKKLCHQTCGPCIQPVDKVVPSCGHQQKMKCHQNPLVFKCRHPCSRTLSQCGHKCKNMCGEVCEVQCTEEVLRQWPCTHIIRTKCYQTPDNHACTAKCDAILQCGHQCSGTCGDCRQGRLHVPCKHNCGRILVCGHACEEPCTSNCPPCQKRCENRCSHSKCLSSCGKLCVPCKEPCDWKCVHFKCRKLCCEPCDRQRCDKPCKKPLKCGHECIGVCGEKCPNKCRVCDKKEVTDIFFGTEDEDDALFVQLEDCNDIFEVSGLDHWMDSAQDTSSGHSVDIQMKTCPKCKTVIRRNRRYGNILNATLADIEQVKRRVIGGASENDANNLENERLALLREIGKQRHAWPYEDFRTAVDANAVVTKETIAIVTNQLNFAKRIEKAKKKIDAEIKGNGRSSVTDGGLGLLERMRQMRMRLTDTVAEGVNQEDHRTGDLMTEELDTLLKWISRPRLHISEQELDDFNTELARMSLLVTCHILRVRSVKQNRVEATVDADEVLRMLTSGKKLDARSEADVKSKLKAIEVKLGGLGISDDERVEIVKAMELSSGHWYKCPNNHIYAIGDCGGATVESTCPECKARIGGTGHRLLSTNRLASEMDGARHSAWSEQANLANYDNLDLD